MPRKQKAGFRSKEVVLLNCTAGNFDHANGEPATIIWVSTKKGDVEPLSINLSDTRKLVVRLLMSLHTAEDGFATKVVTDNFPLDDEGRPFWPPKN